MQPGWASAFRFLGFGWAVVVAIVLPLIGGVWLDRRLHTTPLFTLLGVAVGLAAAARTIYQMVKLARPLSRNGSPDTTSQGGR